MHNSMRSSYRRTYKQNMKKASETADSKFKIGFVEMLIGFLIYIKDNIRETE